MKRLFALLLLGAVVGESENGWLRVQSEHFEVLTDAGAGTGREVLRRLEQIRHVFEVHTQRSKLTPLPVRVFVFRGEADFRPYRVHPLAVGYYQPGTDRDYIAMQMTGSEGYRVVYHEYTHMLLRHAGLRMPVWFNEGVAELFSTADVRHHEVRVGDLIPAHLDKLRERRMMDLPTLMAVDHRSPFYNERDKTGMFYAQSWALVHMLNFAPEYRTRAATFVQMVLAGENSLNALRQAFSKEPSQVMQDLNAYVLSGHSDRLRVSASKFDDRELRTERVPSVASRLALADLLVTIGKLDDARLAYGKLEAAYPAHPELLAALSQFAVRVGDFAGARNYLDRAIATGASSAQLFYDYAIVLRNLNEPEGIIVEKLRRAVTLDDRLFQAHELLGYLHLQAEQYAHAVHHLRRAAELQPRRASVLENLATAHAKSGQTQEARTVAEATRGLATSIEERARIDALLDSINSDDSAMPPRVENQESAAPPVFSRVEGALTQVDCLGKQARLHITVPGRKVLLLVRDATAVRIGGTGDMRTEVPCGSVAPRAVAAEYRGEVHATYGTVGTVVSMEFR